jgi:hypothetical protein
MPRPQHPENKADLSARRKLEEFLKKARGFLDRVHRSVTRDTSRVGRNAKDSLSILWKDADRKLAGVIESQTIGNPKWRRNALDDAGVFNEELNAKNSLLDHFLEEKRFLAGLRLLASIFGSLSKAFPVLSAVKEFIDAVLCCRDWLPTDPEITSLGDLRS